MQWIKIFTSIFGNPKIQLLLKERDGDTIFRIWIQLLTIAGTSAQGGKIMFSTNQPLTVEDLAKITQKTNKKIKKEISMEPKFMSLALKEAEKAYGKLEIPVGAVIVKKGKIIARAHNLKETKQSAISHAEILAIQKANKKLNNWRLIDCDMYVTLEPCQMCMGAIISSRIKNIYIGTLDPKKEKQIDINKYKEEYDINIEYGIMQEKCEGILKEFFKTLRKNGGKNDN